MKPLALRHFGLLLLVIFLSWWTMPGVADQVEMQNGDRYNGKVLSLDEKSLVLQNDVLGKLTLPRARVAVVLLGTISGKTLTNSVAKTGGVSTNSLAAELASHSNIVSQVQKRFLAGAEPEAQQKFNALVSGLLDGSITVQDVQREARTAAERVRALKKELGPDASFALDGYLAILDQFLKEAPPEPSTTNKPAAKAPAPSD